MADAYRRYGDSRQQSAALLFHLPKRSRSDYEMPSGQDLSSYYTRADDRGQRVIEDGHSINASYDRYTAQNLYGGESGRSMSGGLGGFHHIDDARYQAIGQSDPAIAPNSRSMRLGGRSELPPDASSTLFVEGLPANCTCREVAHIFRPFIGYKEVRLVNKGSRHSGRLPAVLCFVEFQSPAHAATAMDAVQGYKFDEHDHESENLRLQFARNSGARSGGGHRGKH